MNSRKTRLPEIIDILTHQVISSQEDLSRQLAVRGHFITQATLSRDLKLLKANKISDDRGSYRYIIGDSKLNGRSRGRRKDGSHGGGDPDTTDGNHNSVLSISITGNIVVIKTRNGYASGLAYDIDTLGSALVLGTIPGTDTVFVAMREGTPKIDIYNLFSTFLPSQIMIDARGFFNE